jgi:hypothetical protein
LNNSNAIYESEEDIVEIPEGTDFKKGKQYYAGFSGDCHG